MKRTVSLILVLVAIGTMLVSCGKDETIPDGYQLVSGDDVAYRFYAPTQWSINNAGTSYSAFYSITDMSTVMVNFFYPTTDNTDIDSFWDYIDGQYKENYENYELLESKVAVTLGTRPAYSYTFTAKISGADYKIMQVFTGYGSYYYGMTYMSTPDNFDKHMEEVSGMMGVFEFR